jgi:A/G-specific adenine glycosylase
MKSMPPAGTLSELRGALLAHYDDHRRRLPWRGETDPYRILVSEVMLQQTRVETVVDYYDAWLERFPSLETLASADADAVLEAWEGLGYYRRARNLHRTARLVRERPDGSLPSNYEQLRGLPGIGEYTAGAVASIAFGQAVPAPDGNVRRVLARLFDEPEPRPAWVRDTAAALLDRQRPGDWNQALMELGATVCAPRGPRCDVCPVAKWCAARATGTQEARPAPSARRQPRRSVFAVAVLHHEGRVLLRRRPIEGLLGGMWAFPEMEVESAEEVGNGLDRLLDELGLAAAEVEPDSLPSCEHRFTHLHATYLPNLVDVVDAVAGRADVTWVVLADPVGVALPVAQRRILESARDRLGTPVS